MKPDSFLQSPFSKNTDFIITEGWYYSQQELDMHGVEVHHSVDFAFPTGTPILAAADGIAVASFDERKVPNDRKWKGKPIYFGYGLVVKILHKNGWSTLYGHLNSIAEELAYYPPLENSDGDLDMQNVKVTNSEAKKIKSVPVKAGQLIGYSGITGMGWGERTYDNWLDGKKFEVCDEEHLHFQVIRFNEDENERVDPFGIYDRAQAYPSDINKWPIISGSLWLPERKNRQPSN